MKVSGIYQIQSKIHPERIYIGSAVDMSARKRRHLFDLRNDISHNKKFQNHFNKYGEQDLQFTVLEECIKELLIQREQYYIDTLNPYFNIAKIAGSPLGCKQSEEVLAYLSKIRKGKSSPNKGKTASIELRDKLSRAHIGQIAWNRGLKGVQKAWNKDIPHSVEHKNNLRRAWIIRKQKQTA